jgi:3-deoxy-D-manno-octulosonate 8-phosphate phosphatase (KDO 8-P phosphatase)
MALADIRLMVFDVDGVLTDGRLYYGPDGEALKVFHVRDGEGLKRLMRAGVEVALLSARDSAALRRRAAELGIARLVTGNPDKGPALAALAAELGLPLAQVGYAGDDLLDLPAMRLAGWTACPADAIPEVRAAAGFVAGLPGGAGAAREIAEHLLGALGRRDAAPPGRPGG